MTSRPNTSLRRLLGLALGVLVLALLAGCKNTLPDGPGGLPYRIEKHGAPLKGVLSADMADLDGDGVEEFLTFSRAPNGAYHYLAVRKQVGDSIMLAYQFNKPWLFQFSGALDIDGDGTPEVFVCRQVDTEWAELAVLDVLIDGDGFDVEEFDEATPVRLRLPDTLIDGLTWDGRILAIDVLDGDGDGWSELVTFASRAGLAKGPRGIGRADISTGEIMWYTPFAGAPEEIVCVADLDGDSENEYVADFNSPGNGVRVGDMTDSEAWVAAVDGDGSVVWRHRLGGLSAGGWPCCSDVTGDGRLEVVTWQSYGRSAHPDTVWLTLWDGETGQRVARWPNRGSINAVELGGAAAPRSVFLCGEDGFIRRITWDGQALVCDREIDCVEMPMGIGLADVDPILVPVLIGMTAEGTVFALDTDLEPLALLKTDEIHDCHASILPMTYPTGSRGAAVGIGFDRGFLFIDFQKSPLPLWVFVTGSIALVLFFCLAVPQIRRRLLSLLRRLIIPRADREKALDELLGALVRAGHGKLSATSTLRRLKQQLTMLGGLDHTPPDEFVTRYREALANVREIGMPGVEAIHREAAGIGLEPSRVSGLRRELAAVRVLMREVPAPPPAAAESVRLSERLDAATASLDTALDRVLEACRMDLSSDLMNEIRRAAGARRSDFIELGAELTVPAVSKIEGARVLGTRAEASFIIENLIANALAAVERSDVRHVEVAVEADGDEVVMRVSDTGVGIPPGMHERIFDDGVSGTHGGGGHGLAESRRILSKRGGAISVVQSKPGRGTTFEVRFQVVDGGAS